MKLRHLASSVYLILLSVCFSSAASSNTWDVTSAPPGLAGDGYGIGDTAYDFTARDQFGDEVSLYQFYGKTIVLDFCTIWCTACQNWSSDLNNQDSTLDTMGYAGQYQVLELLFEDLNGVPADQNDATVWVKMLSISMFRYCTHRAGQDTTIVDLAISYLGLATTLPAFVVIDPQMKNYSI